MMIDKSDIESGLDPLPVRAGCSGFACACTGRCREIVGFIDRKSYIDFMATYISEYKFIMDNMVLIPKMTMKRTLVSVRVTYDNSRPSRSMYAVFAKRAMPSDESLEFYKELIEAELVQDQKHLDFILDHKEQFERFIAQYEGKAHYEYSEGY